jgi:glycosyltransferase involved in cell wall biosynthesis
MRILIATTHRNMVGGVERYLQVLIPGLMDRGHQLGLLYESSFDAASESIDPAGARLAAWRATRATREEVLGRVAEWRPEVVYSQGLEDGDLEDSILQSYRAVLYAHNYFGTCISGRKCHAFPVLQPCERRFGPACLALYYPRRCGGLNPATMLRMYERQSKSRARFSRWQALLVASRHMYQEFQNNGVRPDQLHLMPLPMDYDIGTAAPAAKQDSEDLTRILFMGRLTDIKGADYLVRATAQASRQLDRSLTLTLAGDGPELARVQALAQALGVSIRHAGWVRGTEKAQLLRDTDLLVAPSVWPEPFGLVGIEAGLQGVPAAAFGVGGIPDWLIPGVTGELAPGDPPTTEGLAAAMARALADREHYQWLSRGAREMARRFTLESHLDLLDPILANCVSAGSAAELSQPAAREITT